MRFGQDDTLVSMNEFCIKSAHASCCENNLASEGSRGRHSEIEEGGRGEPDRKQPLAQGEGVVCVSMCVVCVCSLWCWLGVLVGWLGVGGGP